MMIREILALGLSNDKDCIPAIWVFTHIRFNVSVCRTTNKVMHLPFVC